MSAANAIAVVRFGWLTLAAMMLFSRVVFQTHGAVWMRAFLDGWQQGGVKRAWGAVALGYAVFVAVAVVPRVRELGTFDLALLVVLLLVLVADGLVNVLPSGFETFKDRMQRAWAARRGGGDANLFATGNALLAAASATAAAAVVLYRPISAALVVAAALTGAALTAFLIGAANRGVSRRT